MATITGTPANEILTGTEFADSIAGLEGDDTLAGLGDIDILDGGDDTDSADYSDKTASVVVTLNGATDATVSVGGVAEDTIRNIENVIGGSGSDTLTGDALANALNGGAGDDVLKGDLGIDDLDGAAGADTADYSDKTDSVVVTLNTSNNATVSVGGVAEDTIRNIENVIGGSGNDTITGDSLANSLKGGLGNDILDGAGGGADTADYSDKTDSVVVTLNGAIDAIVSVGGVAEDTIRNIENVIGGSGNDTITGDSLANSLRGGLGNDILDGAGGTDTADYSDKTASVVVALNGALDATVSVGGLAEDTIRNIENVIGGSGSDTLIGDALANTLKGGLGNDFLDGAGGTDTADYSDKTASVVVTLNGASDATVSVGGVAEDTIRNIENVTGGSGNDTITGDSLANILKGGSGNDVLDGAGGVDTADYSDKTASVVVTLNGALDATVSVGGVAEDTIRNIENVIGGSGADILIGDGLANTFRGALGNDIALMGAGDDVFQWDPGDGSDTVEGQDGLDTLLFNGAGANENIDISANGDRARFFRDVATITMDLNDVERIDFNALGGADNIVVNDLTGTDVTQVNVNLASTLGGSVGDGQSDRVTVNGANLGEAISVVTSGTSASITGLPASINITTLEAIDSIVVNGLGGADTIDGSGSTFALTLNGGLDDDVLKGGLGNDVLDGADGAGDTADYSDKTASVVVTLNGAIDATVSVGGVVEDTIRNIENVIGGSGSDTLTGDALANILQGGLGNDTLDGAAGADTADYSDKTDSVVVTLNTSNNATVSVGGVAEDTIRNIENVIGGSGNDTITGDSLANVLDGGGGNDLLKGGTGIDVLDGGDGVDTGDYSDKSDDVSVTLNGSSDVIVDIGGLDETIRNIENLIGGSGDDTLVGDSLDNVLKGGTGIDFLDGGAGIDTGDYSDKSADVQVTLNRSNDATVDIGGVDETIRNIENIRGGSGDDTITGDTGANRLEGGSGEDALRGRGADDVLIGGANSDTFIFGDSGGEDTVQDFANGSDKFDLTRVADVDSFADLDINDLGSTVEVDFGTGSFIIANVGNTGVIDANDFIFA